MKIIESKFPYGTDARYIDDNTAIVANPWSESRFEVNEHGVITETKIHGDGFSLTVEIDDVTWHYDGHQQRPIVPLSIHENNNDAEHPEEISVYIEALQFTNGHVCWTENPEIHFPLVRAEEEEVFGIVEVEREYLTDLTVEYDGNPYYVRLGFQLDGSIVAISGHDHLFQLVGMNVVFSATVASYRWLKGEVS